MQQQNHLSIQQDTSHLGNFYSEKKVQIFNVLRQYKVLPSQENVEKIESLSLHGKRELVKDLLCFLFKKENKPQLLEKYKGEFPLIEEATINSYLPDLLIMANLLPPAMYPVDLLSLMKNYGGDLEQLANLRYCTCETIIPKIDLPFSERFHSATSPYREAFLQEIFGNQDLIS